jgi:4-amino-4-deoxy-L-arabinose transferase-like glycosyltransferase
MSASLKNPLTKYSALFLVAYAWISLVTVGIFSYSVVPDTTPVLAGDSSEYVVLAHALLEGRPYSLSVGEVLYPDSFRTPGYSLFLASLLYVFGTLDAVVPIQLLMFACTAWILFVLGERLFSTRVAYVVYGMWLCNPLAYFTTIFVWSDYFFTFVFLLTMYSAYSAVYAEGTKRTLLTALCGLLMGYSILARPVAQFIPLLIAIAALVWIGYMRHKGASIRTPLRLFGVWAVACAVVVTPWVARNYQVFGVVGISSVSAYNVLFYNLTLHNLREQGPGAVSLIPQGVDLADISRFRSYEYDPLYKHAVKEYLAEHWLSYGVYHGVKTIPFFLANSYMDLGMYFTREVETTYRSAEFSEMLLSFDVQGFATFFWGRVMARDGFFFLFIGNIFFWLLVYACMGYACVRALLQPKNYERLAVCAVSVILVLYFGVLTGPVATPRYRLPVEPYILLVASAGMVSLYDSVKKGMKARPV